MASPIFPPPTTTLNQTFAENPGAFYTEAINFLVDPYY